MPFAFANLRVGEPVRHHSVAVFPLFGRSQSEVDYRLSDEALADQSAVVEEISESGSVADLQVENKSGDRLLFLEGEQLIGAKQNRILNTSVLVAAHSTLRIPVSCVEQGRWRYKSRSFAPSDAHSPAKLRRALKASVTRSARQKRGHVSDQSEVWDHVAALQQSHGVASETTAMSDAFVAHEHTLAEQRVRLKYVEGATGVAVAVGDKVVAVDLFDKPSTCRKVWDRLLSGILFESLEAQGAEPRATAKDVELALEAAARLSWDQIDAVGEGQEYRAESPSGDHASALVFGHAVIHGSILPAA